MLGEFEYLLITAAAGLGDKAYGAAIREGIEESTGRKCSIGALYTTIDRLETKGLPKTWMSDATPQRGGRAKRMVRVTPEGVLAAKSFYDAVIRGSRGASGVANRNGSSLCPALAGHSWKLPLTCWSTRTGKRFWATWQKRAKAHGRDCGMCWAWLCADSWSIGRAGVQGLGSLGWCRPVSV